jgi:hypothetical protein
MTVQQMSQKNDVNVCAYQLKQRQKIMYMHNTHTDGLNVHEFSPSDYFGAYAFSVHLTSSSPLL